MFGQAAGASTNTGSGFSFGGGATAANTAPKPAFSFGGAGSTTPAPAPASAGTGFSLGQPATSTNTGLPSFGRASSTMGTSSTGAATATPATNGLFGAKPAAPAAANTGFSFSNNTPTATSNPLGSFNIASKPQSTFGAFGKPAATPMVNNNGLGGLGQPTTQPAAQSTSFNSQPSFSWSSSSAPANPTSNVPQATSTGFGFSGPTTINTVTPTVPTTSQISTSRDYAPTINDKLSKIKTSWDSTNPQCRMVTHFYNKVDPLFTNFTRPANESPEEWENAMKNRPKDYNSIPVKCCGFNDLFERDQLQNNHVKQTRILLNEINDKLTKLNEKHDLHSNNLLLKCKLKQKNLSVKLLKIAINLSILKYKGYPLTNDEELLISHFNNLLSKLDDPIGLNRINELWARLSSIKDKYSDTSSNLLREKLDVMDNTNGKTGKNDDGDVIKKLVKVLAKQQQGIQLLCEMMEEDEVTLNRLAGQ